MCFFLSYNTLVWLAAHSRMKGSCDMSFTTHNPISFFFFLFFSKA